MNERRARRDFHCLTFVFVCSAVALQQWRDAPYAMWPWYTQPRSLSDVLPGTRTERLVCGSLAKARPHFSPSTAALPRYRFW